MSHSLFLGAVACIAGMTPPTGLAADASPENSAYKSVFTQPPLPLPRYQQLDAPLMGNGDMAVAVCGNPENQQFWLGKNDLWELRNVWCRSGPRPFGHLDLLIPQLAGATYHAEQDLADATTIFSFITSDSEVTMRSWVCATENLLVVELNVQGVPVEGDVHLWIPAAPRTTPQVDHRPKPGMADDWVNSPAAQISRTGTGVFWGARIFREGVDVPAETACAFTVLGEQSEHFKIEPGRPVILAAEMRSLRQSEQYASEACARVAALDRSAVAGLYDDHAKWWRDFWDRSSVNLGDANLEWRYNVSNYLLASCSRDPVYPPGIAGTWVTTDQPMWTGAYTLNYNHEACFYGLYSSNHIEQADPEDAPVLDFMARGRYYAKEVLHCRGVLYPVKIGPVGIETTGDARHPDFVASPADPPWLREKGGLFLGQRSNAAFAAVNIAQRWYTTYDLAYGRKVYPFVHDVANFWEDYLKFEPTPPALVEATKNLPDGLRQPADGRYVSDNDGANEGGQDVNPAVSLALVRNVLKLALDLSVSLGEDEPELDHWRHILGHLSAFSTQEFEGATVFRRAEKLSPPPQPKKDHPPGKPGPDATVVHIYPGGAIGLDSDPKLLEIARRTITALNQWTSMNSTSSIFPAAARVGYDPAAILAKLGEVRFQPNGILYNEFHMLENSSTVPNTIDEMLMQSHEGIIRLFPVWPVWRDASFRTLRAYGAFLVSAAIHHGNVKDVTILSEQGRPCVLRNPWPGRGVQILSAGKPAQIVRGDRLTFATAPGERVELAPSEP